VPPTAKQGKPYIVNRMVEADGKVRGTFFGYFERVQDQIPPTSAQALQGLLRDGLRFTDILDRLDWLQDSLGVASSLSAAEMLERLETIEAKLVKSTSVASPGPSDLDVSKRIAEAEEAVGRTSRANIIMAATSTTECTFPDLFRSRSAPIVKLLMDPPVLRQEGFAITPLGSAIPADIVQGKLRRVVWKGQKLAELWKDGCLVAIGPGDDDLLCWFTRSHRDPKPGLPIRSFVLAEVVLNFCNFAVQVFGYAEPAPQRLRFGLTLNNMTEDGVPCKLSTAPDNNSSFGFSYYAKEAPAATISVTSIMDFKNADPGVIAYQLLGSLYVEFGFEVDGTPYIQRDGDDNRITRQSLFNEPRS
jgi:hypothetical protein